MQYVFVYVAFVLLVVSSVTHAQEQLAKLQNERIVKEDEENTIFKKNAEEELFRRLFVRRRKEHLEAIRNLQKINNYERLYKMVMILAEKIIGVIEFNKRLIENAGFTPNNNIFPKDANLRDALSTILENTALFGDIILHLPDITHRVLKKQQKWNDAIKWSLNFANQTRHLLDNSTLSVIHLVNKKLSTSKEDSDYFNPHWSASIMQGSSDDISKKQKIQKKNKRKRGPQMAKIEL